MKKIIILFTILSSFSNVFSQSFSTQYTRGLKSSYCGEETFEFNFESRTFSKLDKYYGTENYGPSKITQSGYDDKGYFFEVRSPKFILDEQGVDGYRRYYHFSHKILYDRKGGNILYVYEIDMDLNNSEGKFYFTQAGYQKYCQ